MHTPHSLPHPDLSPILDQLRRPTDAPSCWGTYKDNQTCCQDCEISKECAEELTFAILEGRNIKPVVTTVSKRMHDNRQVLYIGFFGTAAFIATCGMSVDNGALMGFNAGLVTVIMALLILPFYLEDICSL